MARTVRRKGFAAVIGGYVERGLLKDRHSYEYDSYGLRDINRRKIGDIQYDEYAQIEILRFHRDKTKSSWRFHLNSISLPRDIRRVDRNRQKRAHKLAIQSAVRSGDYDVALVDRGNDILFDWIMYY